MVLVNGIKVLKEIMRDKDVFCWNQECASCLNVKLRIVDSDEASIEVAPMCDICYDLLLKQKAKKRKNG